MLDQRLVQLMQRLLEEAAPSTPLRAVSRRLKDDFNIGRVRGCKPKPPKIPSTQFEPRHDRIQIDDLAIAVKCVVPIQMNMAPRRRRNLFEQG